MRFRFTIRDLLWLTALVAVLVAWWIDHKTTDRIVRNTSDQLDRETKHAEDIERQYHFMRQEAMRTESALRTQLENEHFRYIKLKQQKSVFENNAPIFPAK